jgi:hypothetical protein
MYCILYGAPKPAPTRIWNRINLAKLVSSLIVNISPPPRRSKGRRIRKKMAKGGPKPDDRSTIDYIINKNDGRDEKKLT